MRVLPAALASLVSILAAVLGTGCPSGTEPKADAGPVDDAGPFASAKHPALPEVESFGGNVLQTPKVAAVYFAGDPQEAEVQPWLPELQSSGWWTTVTSEYGVGDLQVSDPIHLGVAPPPFVDGDTLRADLVQLVPDGDPSTIYMVVIPEGTFFQDFGACCVDYFGFHESDSIGGHEVPVAYACPCEGVDGPGFTNLDELAVTISHELAEAATDPFDGGGFADVDADHTAWDFVLGGGEIADLCDFADRPAVQPPGLSLPVQRVWSNKAAKANHDPCVPALDGEPGFGAVPVLDDTVSIPDGFGDVFVTKGKLIKVGDTATIDVKLYTDQRMGDFAVEAVDASEFFGLPPHLRLKLDDNHGNNGDTLHLTATVVSADDLFGAEIFVLTSRYDLGSTLAVGVIAQH